MSKFKEGDLARIIGLPNTDYNGITVKIYSAKKTTDSMFNPKAYYRVLSVPGDRQYTLYERNLEKIEPKFLPGDIVRFADHFTVHAYETETELHLKDSKGVDVYAPEHRAELVSRPIKHEVGDVWEFTSDERSGSKKTQYVYVGNDSFVKVKDGEKYNHTALVIELNHNEAWKKIR